MPIVTIEEAVIEKLRLLPREKQQQVGHHACRICVYDRERKDSV